MAKVSKRKLPSGVVRWQARFKDAKGNRRFKLCDTKAEAEQYLASLMVKVAGGTFVADRESVTLATAGNLYLENREAKHRQASTLRDYRQHLQLHINPVLGGKLVTKVTKLDVENLTSEIATRTSADLARRVLRTLRAVLRHAQNLELCSVNVASTVDAPSARATETEDADDLKMPTKEQFNAILSVVDGRARAMILVAAFCGLRASELRALKWSDIDFAARKVTVRRRADYRGHIGPTKSRSGKRDVPLGPIVAVELERWRDVAPQSDLDLVFATSERHHRDGTHVGGRCMSHSNIVRRIWHPALKAAKVWPVNADGSLKIGDAPFGWHSLRHFYASLLIERGMQHKRIAALMGHTDIAFTMNRYGHLFPDRQNDLEAIAAVEAGVFAVDATPNAKTAVSS